MKPSVQFMAPYAFTNVYGGGALTLSKSVGSSGRSYLNVGAGIGYKPVTTINRVDSEIEGEKTFEFHTEDGIAGEWFISYDRYTNRGNVFYVGVDTGLPFYGFTWAREHLHFGVVGSLASLFVPLPYG